MDFQKDSALHFSFRTNRSSKNRETIEQDIEGAMLSDGGLPDYIADHFRYLVRCSKPARLGQLAFFGLGIGLPLVGAFVAPTLVEHHGRWLTQVLIGLAVVCAASLRWYGVMTHW